MSVLPAGLRPVFDCRPGYHAKEDGIKHKRIKKLIVLLVVDQADNKDNSILETKSVTFTKGKVSMVPYLENYPFPYYVLLPNSALLPEILSDSLRQWFEMLQMKN